MSEKTEEKRSFYSDYVKQVANMFINKMKEGRIPWQMGWESYSMWPQSAVTKKLYHGMNCLYLYLCQAHYNYEDPRWITAKQAAKLGGVLKEDAKGVSCIYWTTVPHKDGFVKESKKNSRSKSSDPWFALRPAIEPKISYGMIPCPFVVYNVEQFYGLKLEDLVQQKHEWTPIEKAEQLVKATGAVIIHEKRAGACYIPSKDEIHLPLKDQFLSPEHYYDTLLHETGHWTGHSTRLNRKMSTLFGSEQYAKEELRAEIASAMLTATIGIHHDIGNHVAYLQSWIEVLKDDPKEIFKAAADAEKIKDYIISKDPELMELYGKPKPKPKKAKTKREEIKNRSE